MLDIKWSSFSLRHSLVLSMVLTLLPLLVSAGLGYFILHKTVVGDYQDVAHRQHDLLLPIRRMQLLMLRMEIPLEEYLISGSEAKLRDFHGLRQEVESSWPRIMPLLDGELAALTERSRSDWSSMDGVAADLVAAKESGNREALLQSQGRFDSLQASVHDKLEALSVLIEQDIERDYRDASLGLERSEWVAGIAAGISLLLMVGGITIFYGTILNSVNRLIEGAGRFSEGDRDHKIEIAIPRELHQVAEELNRMIGIIRKSEDRLVEMARHDKLTGLLNRAAWDEVLAEALQRLHRLHESFALVTADIDHFKKINDAYGHDAGDEVLRSVAGVMTESVRLIDKVFRTGGEEFSILLPATDAISARVAAERIRRAVENRVLHAGGNTLRITISLGIAVATRNTDTAKALSKQADIALYKAKTAGRNTVVIYERGIES